MKITLLLSLFLLTFHTKGQNNDISSYDFYNIDKHALHCPQDKVHSIDAIADYLNSICSNDLERARAAFVWITNNIRYDDKAINNNKLKNSSLKQILRRKKGVCEDYASLYVALGERMGLKIMKVHGYAKGYGYRNRTRFRNSNHAWNLIKINGSWEIFDATWGGSAAHKKKNGKLESVKVFDPYWFAIPSYKSIFTHLPENPDYSMVSPVVSLRDFEKMPILNKAFFKLGYNARETYHKLYPNTNVIYPQYYEIEDIQVITAPQQKYLHLHKTYALQFTSNNALRMFTGNYRKHFNEFKKEGNTFTLEFTPKMRGKLTIYCETTSGILEPIIEYFVKD
ncbi:transglutaminase domain-containing protein [Neptunitalea lumnitzerae]|uniref:Transglutaminase-like domain-containing protein n=1 Tax=Neptunitalea lumnitzerae TaxID=2965509 RepID=A0ABQ5MF32_9FLAO|nr:transglutaminase domain-containing protein [Neptunitalea sp. Y10]GLB47921.1 hypothetical protein Y10_02890 [Neptunitalea sp. Y10]